MPGNDELMFEIDARGNFISVSHEALAFLGYTEGEIKAMSVWDVIDPDDLESILEKFMDRPKISPGQRFRVHVNTKDGRRLTIDVEPIPVMRGNEIVSVTGRIYPTR